MHPIEARSLGRRIGELEEVFDYAADLAAHRVALALAQILDLLGHMLAIKPVIGDGHRAQHPGLVLRPGVEIVLVAWSVRHRRPQLSLISWRGRPQFVAAATARSTSFSSISPSSTRFRAAAAMAST